MATNPSSTLVNEYDLYPVHEEDNVPESWIHEWTVRYLRNVLDFMYPDWFIAGNMCIYWQKGNKRRYLAPDVFVVRQRVSHHRRRKNYLLWLDPPVSFVLEIGSDSTRKKDIETKPALYAEQIKAQEYLFADPPDEEKPTREMWLLRLGPDGYQKVAPEANERLRSEVLDVEFGWDEAGWLRIYVDGVAQRTFEETEGEREREARARREAEARAGEELLRREESETRRHEAEARRRDAEARAQAEVRQREEAEARAAELERELAALRARLRDQDGA